MTSPALIPNFVYILLEVILPTTNVPLSIVAVNRRNLKERKIMFYSYSQISKMKRTVR